MENENKELDQNKSLEKEGAKNRLEGEVISWIQVLVSAAVIAFVLTTFVIANSEVPTGSMENTIMAHSRVIGSRLHYKFADPERGDVAIFVFGWQCPRCTAIGEGEDPAVCPACGYELGKRAKTVYYVKRVIGLPGDVIDIIDDKVYLNGSETPLEEPYLAEEMNQGETMHFEVPEDCYFMMGDNRNFPQMPDTGKNPTFPKTSWWPRFYLNTSPPPRSYIKPTYTGDRIDYEKSS